MTTTKRAMARTVALAAALSAAGTTSAYEATGFITEIRVVNDVVLVDFSTQDVIGTVPNCHSGPWEFRTQASAGPLMKEILTNQTSSVTLLSTDSCENGVQTIKAIIVKPNVILIPG